MFTKSKNATSRFQRLTFLQIFAVIFLVDLYQSKTVVTQLLIQSPNGKN
jgi:hypothetical protein